MKEIEIQIENLKKSMTDALETIAKLRVEVKSINERAAKVENLDSDFYTPDVEQALDDAFQGYLSLYASLVRANVEEKLNNLDF